MSICAYEGLHALRKAWTGLQDRTEDATALIADRGTANEKFKPGGNGMAFGFMGKYQCKKLMSLLFFNLMINK